MWLRSLTDWQTRIADPAFDADRTAVLENARRARVAPIVAVGETLEDRSKILELAANHPELWLTLGVHPTEPEVEQANRVQVTILRRSICG